MLLSTNRSSMAVGSRSTLLTAVALAAVVVEEDTAVVDTRAAVVVVVATVVEVATAAVAITKVEEDKGISKDTVDTAPDTKS